MIQYYYSNHNLDWLFFALQKAFNHYGNIVFGTFVWIICCGGLETVEDWLGKVKIPQHLHIYYYLRKNYT